MTLGRYIAQRQEAVAAAQKQKRRLTISGVFIAGKVVVLHDYDGSNDLTASLSSINSCSVCDIRA